MFIPGFLISIVTFPGVIIHELAHQVFCRLCGLEVYEVKYFQVQNPNGYVIHQSSDQPFKVFLPSMGPFFINTLLGILIILPASVELLVFNEYNNVLNLVLILKNPEVNVIWKILSAPFIGLIYLCAVGSFFWLDLLYAVAVGMLVPNLLVMAL